jgi:hypothetical protein
VGTSSFSCSFAFPELTGWLRLRWLHLVFASRATPTIKTPAPSRPCGCYVNLRPTKEFHDVTIVRDEFITRDLAQQIHKKKRSPAVTFSYFINPPVVKGLPAAGCTGGTIARHGRCPGCDCRAQNIYTGVNHDSDT